MAFYSYVITRDYGFAPNPYFGYCTLATCKPIIRRCAKVGDWIGAFGGSSTNVKGRMVMMMKVKEALTFDEYWNDSRFQCKKPVFTRGMNSIYGDNIYHHVGNKWTQEMSHHSLIGGGINYINLNKDTETDRVLISEYFFYFGNNAVLLPSKYSDFVWDRRNHKVQRNEQSVLDFVQYITSKYIPGINGIPFSRKTGVFVQFKG